MLANNVHVYSPNPRCLLHMHDDPTVHSVFMKLLGPEEAAHARIETVDSFQVRQQASWTTCAWVASTRLESMGFWAQFWHESPVCCFPSCRRFPVALRGVFKSMWLNDGVLEQSVLW